MNGRKGTYVDDCPVRAHETVSMHAWTRLEGVLTETVHALGQDRKGASDAQDGEWLGREAATRLAIGQRGRKHLMPIRARPKDDTMEARRSVQANDIRREDDPTEPRTQHYLDRTPVLARDFVEVSGEGDARQEIGEEDVNGARHDELVEDGPVGPVSASKAARILSDQPKGLKRAVARKRGAQRRDDPLACSVRQLSGWRQSDGRKMLLLLLLLLCYHARCIWIVGAGEDATRRWSSKHCGGDGGAPWHSDVMPPPSM